MKRLESWWYGNSYSIHVLDKKPILNVFFPLGDIWFFFFKSLLLCLAQVSKATLKMQINAYRNVTYVNDSSMMLANLSNGKYLYTHIYIYIYMLATYFQWLRVVIYFELLYFFTSFYQVHLCTSQWLLGVTKQSGHVTRCLQWSCSLNVDSWEEAVYFVVPW